MNITVNGYNTYYTDEGQGEPIVFLHGWGSSCDAFARMGIPLKERYRCIRVDLPGFGKSDMLKTPFTLEDYCDFVKAFLDALGLSNPIMFGHSNGGRITLKMCAENMVCPPKIVLFGSAGIRSKRSMKSRIRTRTYKIIKGALTLPIVRNFTQDALEVARNHFGSADYRNAPPVLRQTLVNLINVDLREILPNIKASTLLIWGECDTETPLSHAKVIESKIKDCGLCVLEGGSHFAFVEQPARVDAILKSFL